jgi:hypothetical protein
MTRRAESRDPPETTHTSASNASLLVIRFILSLSDTRAVSDAVTVPGHTEAWMGLSLKPSPWHTLWQGSDIVVQRDGVDVDRVHSPDIHRVVLVYRGAGESPTDLAYALVELADEYAVFPADSGIAGRLHFERQAFWRERECIYWVSEATAGMPARLRRGNWLFGRSRLGYMRVPKVELQTLVERWPLEGPQTWDERKWERIERSRPFSSSSLREEKARRSGAASAR